MELFLESSTYHPFIIIVNISSSSWFSAFTKFLIHFWIWIGSIWWARIKISTLLSVVGTLQSNTPMFQSFPNSWSLLFIGKIVFQPVTCKSMQSTKKLLFYQKWQKVKCIFSDTLPGISIVGMSRLEISINLNQTLNLCHCQAC